MSEIIDSSPLAGILLNENQIGHPPGVCPSLVSSPGFLLGKDKQMLINQTLEKMRAMKLHQMARSLEERLARPDHQDLSVQEIIGLIVDDEFTGRENARLEARLRGAKFKEKAACMEDIDYKANRGFKKQTIIDLGQLKWIEKKQNIAFTGPAGVGKSYLAQALGHRACRSGFRVIYVRLPKLLTAFAQSRADGSDVSLRRWLDDYYIADRNQGLACVLR